MPDGGAAGSLAALRHSFGRIVLRLECGCPVAHGRNCSCCSTRFGLQYRRCKGGRERAPRPRAGADDTVAHQPELVQLGAFGLGVFSVTLGCTCGLPDRFLHGTPYMASSRFASAPGKADAKLILLVQRPAVPEHVHLALVGLHLGRLQPRRVPDLWRSVLRMFTRMLDSTSR